LREFLEKIITFGKYMIQRIYNLGALNLKTNPLAQNDGGLIRAVNVERDNIGGWKQRPGYNTFLGTTGTTAIKSLWSWFRNDGTTNYIYKYSDNKVYYSFQGTGAWSIAGNGTLTGGYTGHAVLDDVMIIGDGASATRHSTNGTSFTNTTSAPLASEFDEFQGRIWAGRGTATTGTATDLIYSTVGTASNWTTDSSSIRIPGAGRINAVFKANDRILATKEALNMFRYDGDSLLDLATDMGPSSPYAIGEVEGYRIWPNRSVGFVGYGGGRPEVISNAIDRQLFNDSGSAVIGTNWGTMQGIVYRNNYFCTVGTTTDDLTGETVSNCIQKYDFAQNEWANWQFANTPTAFGTYLDTAGDIQLIWGDSAGQCYQLSGTALSDNGSSINSVIEGVLHFGVPETDKKFNYIWMFANPGMEATVQIAIGDNFTKGKKKWINLKQSENGVVESRFPEGSRGKLLFYKISDSSRSARWAINGIAVDITPIER
jgi:hypothetical protein